MKNAILLMLLMMSSTTLLAQNQNQNNQNKNNNNQQSVGAQCANTLGAKEVNRADKQTAEIVPVPLQRASSCEKLAIIAKIHGGDINSSDTRPTADGKILCRKTGGFTTDYTSCKNVSLLYDAVLLAEAAMFAQQKITVDNKNAEESRMVAQRTAEGDGQNAAIDAIIARNELNAKINKTQAHAYVGAVAAITASVSFWKGKKGLVNECKNGKVDDAVKYAKTIGVTFTAAECEGLLGEFKDSSEVFANDSAKAQFITAIGSFLMKADAANKRAGNSEFVAKKLGPLTDGVDENTTVLDPCVVHAGSPECANQNSQGNFSSGSFQGNTVDFGAGSSNGFDFGAGNGIGDLAADAPAGDTDSVADVISPFEKQAKIANGILDPASAATTAAGSGSAPAGGGGAGGGGGGGASLGDDLAGATADENKDPDIKTNKLSGKYKGGKSGGFQAVAKSGGKDDANPFASLFDSKSEGGGIEEDRSIASDTGEGSGLFQKISKKYGQIQQEKRINEQALE